MPPSSDKRYPSEVGLDEYLYVAEQVPSYKELARRLNLTFSSMQKDLRKRGIYSHIAALFTGTRGKPGPKPPPLPLVKGVGADSKPDIEEIKRHAIARYKLKDHRVAKKNDQHIYFSHGPVAIFFVGDQHFGNSGTDVERAFKEQEIINATPGAYCWQMGDVVDNFIVGKLIAENMKAGLAVMEQWWLAEHYLEGFKDKLLAFLAGNHGMWTLKMSGVDYNKDITPDGVLYDSDQIKATVHVGGFKYRIWSRHKWRGYSIYNPTHGPERAARFQDSRYDAYVGAHLHRGAMTREFVHDQKRKLAILAGAYKIHDDWATEIGFDPHDSSTAAAIVLHEDGRYFASADIEAVRRYMSTVYTPAA